MIGEHGDRACPRSGHVRIVDVRRRVDQLHDVVQVRQPLPLAAVQHEALDPLALARHRPIIRVAPGSECRDGLGELAFRFGRDRQPGRALDHGRKV